ncbi:MAG: hypothetical protein AAF567_09000 [Actinomycetota bacterium]
MDFSKMTTNNWIAGGGGLVSLINIFLPWYSIDFGLGSVTANAFDAGAGAWLGALLCAAGGILVALKALDVFEAKLGSLATEQLAMMLGALGLLFILLRLLTMTDFTAFGIYLGIIAGGAVIFGALQSGKDIGVGIPSADDFKGDGGGGGSSTF